MIYKSTIHVSRYRSDSTISSSQHTSSSENRIFRRGNDIYRDSIHTDTSLRDDEVRTNHDDRKDSVQSQAPYRRLYQYHWEEGKSQMQSLTRVVTCNEHIRINSPWYSINNCKNIIRDSAKSIWLPSSQYWITSRIFDTILKTQDPRAIQDIDHIFHYRVVEILHFSIFNFEWYSCVYRCTDKSFIRRSYRTRYFSSQFLFVRRISLLISFFSPSDPHSVQYVRRRKKSNWQYVT